MERLATSLLAMTSTPWTTQEMLDVAMRIRQGTNQAGRRTGLSESGTAHEKAALIGMLPSACLPGQIQNAAFASGESVVLIPL